jgi:glycosyltransferase involved in cell wall biosynthesis
MPPQLSIIMSVYNCEETITPAVRSILDQSFTDFEFIIVDDGCTDLTIAHIKELEDSRIIILSNEENIGLTRSLNKAVTRATGQYIARQDADDISMPGRLEKQITFMDAHSDVTVLGTSRGTLDHNGNITSTTLLPKEPDYSCFLRRNCLVHGSIMIRREALIKAGGYNEVFRYTQDYELWLRMAKDHKIMNLQEPLYGIRRHGNRVTLKKMNQANLFRTLARNLSKGKVSEDVVKEVLETGITRYYNHLDDQDKLDFHRTIKNKSIKYKLYKDAQDHLRQIISLRPASLKSRVELAQVAVARYLKR